MGESATDAYNAFQAAREELLVYSRRLGLIVGDATDRDSPAPDLALTVDTAEELLRLDANVKEAWAIYQDTKGEDAEQRRQ
jgi:hypothetical protein